MLFFLTLLVYTVPHIMVFGAVFASIMWRVGHFVSHNLYFIFQSKLTLVEKVSTLMTDLLPRWGFKQKSLFLKCLLDTGQGHILEEIGLTSLQIELIEKLLGIE